MIMFELSGYRVVEKLGSDGEISVYRLARIADGFGAIAKTTSEADSGFKAASAFKYEYEQLLKLKNKGALEPYRLETAADRPVLLLRDPGGTTLDQAMRARRDGLKLPELLRAAVAVAECLRQVHQQGMTLNELTPLHLMISDDFNEVSLIDIRACTTDGIPALPKAASVERRDAVLPYLSPEQTGRTGAAADYRSDFYALGVILYEWLSRRLPFQSQHPLDLTYHHLATTPEPVHAINPSIPRIVSDIVNKCMDKMPEARYASALGIRSDLEECLVQLRVSGKVQPFPLGIRDISERWVKPNGLFGRQDEQQTLLKALAQAAEGTAQTVWITGAAGMGKSSLVLETLRKAIPAEGFFAVGKFGYKPTAHPYEMWRQAIEDVASQLLTANRLQAEVWKLGILGAVQGNGQLLIEMAPRLRLLIGEQPAVQVLPPAEARNRYHLTLIRFLQLFGQRERPLVLFFDDLQGADEASLQLLQDLLADRETKHLLVVGAYRDTELTPSHSLNLLTAQLAIAGTLAVRIHLLPGTPADLTGWLSGMMHKTAAELADLAELLQRKTDGNPLYLKQLLKDLMNRKLLSFDESAGGWQWDLRRIAELDVPGHTGDAAADRLARLPEQAVDLLGKAAVLGRQFELDTLIPLAGLEAEQVAEWAERAVGERLLLPIYGERNAYVFQHDQIRQAAYEQVPEPERAGLHRSIGLLLLRRLRAGETVSLFEVLAHLNEAAALAATPEQKRELAELNLQAGLQAKQSNVHETSLAYMRRAAGLLEAGNWASDYALTFQVHMELAEAEFLNANAVEVQRLFDLLVAKAAADFDRAQACLMMIRMEASRYNWHEAIALGKMAMERLGIKYNFNPGLPSLLLKWVRVHWKLRRRPVESFGSLPPMTDERRKVAMSVLYHTSNASYALNKKGWLFSILTMLEMTMAHGMHPEASSGFAGYALLQNFRFQRFEAAHKWGKLACTASRSHPRLYLKAITSYLMCYDSWSRYEPDLPVAFAEHADRAALQTGDFRQANESQLVNFGVLFHHGHPLKDIYNRLLAQVTNFQRNPHTQHWKQAVILASLISRLTGHRTPGDPFASTDIHDKSFIDGAADESGLLQEAIHICDFISEYLFGNYRQALEAVDRSFAVYRLRQNELTIPYSHYYYHALALAAIEAEGDGRRQGGTMRKMRAGLKMMRTISRRAPENYLHKYLLIKAEIAMLRQKDSDAERLYEQAFQAARSRGHIHDAAIAAECCARYGLRRGKDLLAKLYMNEAYDCYWKWGARAKTADMERKYGHLLQLKRETGLEPIDYFSVVMSAQALSGEMEMDHLLRTLMLIMLQNAGAEYGALVFEYEDRWMVEAYGTAEKLQIESVPLEQAEHLVPTAIIGYTARTKEEIVLHDAAGGGIFERNAYVKSNRVKSALCLPIMHQNRLICLLYMENKLSTGVFTEKRLDVLKLLSSQCAISIANAKLFSRIQYLKNSLEDQVAERTRSLEKSMQETSAAVAEMTVYAERNRIAQEIHDIVGHTLTSTILQIEAGKRLLQKDKDSAATRLKEAQDLVRHSLNEIRNSVHMLKEDKYYDIAQALQQLIRDTERNTGAVVRAAIDAECLAGVSLMHKKVLYHALQEGLTNGIRHGHSNEFDFSLTGDGSQLRFMLADNGTGASHIEMGFGLKMMRDRVEQLQGTLYIDAKPNKGCLLRISLPFSLPVTRGHIPMTPNNRQGRT